jgi:hypothetical protein
MARSVVLLGLLLFGGTSATQAQGIEVFGDLSLRARALPTTHPMPLLPDPPPEPQVGPRPESLRERLCSEHRAGVIAVAGALGGVLGYLIGEISFVGEEPSPSASERWGITGLGVAVGAGLGLIYCL